MIRMPANDCKPQNCSLMSLKTDKDFKNNFPCNLVTSTPLIRKETRKIQCKESDINKVETKNIEVESLLLDKRDGWPLAFSEANQEYLDGLQLNLDKDILILDSQPKCRSRGMSRNLNHRGKSVDRSLSPGGALQSTENKWNINAEILIFLVDQIIPNFNDLSEKAIINDEYKKEAKKLVEKLKSTNKNGRFKLIKEYKIQIVVQSLKYVLRKLGLIIPEIISKQLVLIRYLIKSEGDIRTLKSDRIKAVQTMFFNITRQNRLVLQKVLFLFNNFHKDPKLRLCKNMLGKWLKPSLFTGDDNGSQDKICRDLIILSDELFHPPTGLVELVNKKVNSRISKGVMITVSEVKKPKSSSTKSVKNENSITLNGFRKILSPEQKLIKEPTKFESKQLSFTEITKKICKRALSPLRSVKGSYKIDAFYCQTKKNKQYE